MAEFINTIDVLGDQAVTDSLVSGTVTEFKDDRVTKVGQYGFWGCGALITVDLPNCGTISMYSFASCGALAALILRGSKVCTLGHTYAFQWATVASGTGYIYVPAALVDSYKAATNWSNYADQIRAIEDYPDITGG